MNPNQSSDMLPYGIFIDDVKEEQQIPSVNHNSDTDNLPNGLPNGLFLEEITNITQC